MASRFLGLGNGSDGVIALGSYTPLKYTCSGSSGTSSLTATGTFAAGDRLFIHQSRGTGVGYYEDNRVASYTTGTITLVHPLEHTYTDSGNSQAQVLVVKEASSVTGSITVPAWDGDKGGLFVIACNGVFNGIVNANELGFRFGRAGQNPNGGSSDNIDGEQGEGTAGAGGTRGADGANGNGGGAGDHSTISNEGGNGGAGGGHASAGDPGLVQRGTAGTGGTAVGQAAITSLYFGGGGGGGGF